MNGLKLYCQQLEPSVIRVADITPITDESYPLADAITYWKLTILRDGIVFLESSTDDARSRPWLVDSRDFNRHSFESDIYDIRLEIWGYAKTARRLANYFIRTPLGLNQTVWVQKNGAYYNITDEGQLLSDGDFEWYKKQTYDVYGNFQVRSLGQHVRTESVIVNVLQEQTYDNSGREVMLRSGNEARVFCRSDRERWGKAVVSRVTQLLNGNPNPNRSRITRNDDEAKLDKAGAYLDLLEMGLVLDEGAARGLLKLTKAALRQWPN